MDTNDWMAQALASQQGLTPQQSSLVQALAGQSPQGQKVAGGQNNQGFYVPPSGLAQGSNVLQKALSAYMANRMINQNTNSALAPYANGSMTNQALSDAGFGSNFQVEPIAGVDG